MRPRVWTPGTDGRSRERPGDVRLRTARNDQLRVLRRSANKGPEEEARTSDSLERLPRVLRFGEDGEAICSGGPPAVQAIVDETATRVRDC
jgi:hypothetical protein